MKELDHEDARTECPDCSWWVPNWLEHLYEDHECRDGPAPIGRVMRGTNGGPYWVVEEYGHELGHKLIDGDITQEEAFERRKEELKEEHGGERVEMTRIWWEIYESEDDDV